MKIEITEEIISKADIEDCENCTGALALKSAGFTNVWWGLKIGFGSKNGKTYKFRTFVNDIPVSMMDIKKPTTVTFKPRHEVLNTPKYAQ